MFIVAGGGLGDIILHYSTKRYIFPYICYISATYNAFNILYYTWWGYLRILVFAKNIAGFAKIRQKYSTFVPTKIHFSLECANYRQHGYY
jgi:hypothetical protein